MKCLLRNAVMLENHKHYRKIVWSPIKTSFLKMVSTPSDSQHFLLFFTVLSCCFEIKASKLLDLNMKFSYIFLFLNLVFILNIHTSLSYQNFFRVSNTFICLESITFFISLMLSTCYRSKNNVLHSFCSKISTNTLKFSLKATLSIKPSLNSRTAWKISPLWFYNSLNTPSTMQLTKFPNCSLLLSANKALCN